MSEQCSLAAFEFEQRALGRQSAAEACQRPIRADHAVTGNDDRDRVGAVRHTHGTHRLGVLDAVGQLEITDRFAVRDAGQLFPNLVLELRTLESERGGELFQSAGEILVSRGQG